MLTLTAIVAFFLEMSLRYQKGLVKLRAMFRRLIPQSLLILALLFAQLGGVTHGISHLFSKPSHRAEQPLPNDQHCDLCEVYAQIGGAIHSSSLTFDPQRVLGIPHAEVLRQRVASHFVPFSARAPPYSA